MESAGMLDQIIGAILWTIIGVASASGRTYHLLNCFPAHHDWPLFITEVIVFPAGVVVGWGMILGFW